MPQVRVYEISTASVTDLNNNQICSETVQDADLGFYMWGGKDNAGNVTRWLAKDKNARVVDLSVTGDITLTGGSGTLDSLSIGALADNLLVYGDLQQSTTLNWQSSKLRIGSTTAANKALEVLDASDAQLRLTHTEATDYTDFQVDTNGNMLIDPSGSAIGVSMAPANWDSNYSVLSRGDSGANPFKVSDYQTKDTVLCGTVTHGGYYDATDDRWEYAVNSTAPIRWGMTVSSLGFSVESSTASGTAGNPITWSEYHRLQVGLLLNYVADATHQYYADNAGGVNINLEKARRTGSLPGGGALAGQDGDGIANIKFNSRNDAVSPQVVQYASINSTIVDASDGTEDGDLAFSVMVDGSSTEVMKITGGDVGIGTAAPDTFVHIHKATAGAVVSSTNTHLTVESNGNSGVSILTPDASTGVLYFGSPSDNIGASVQWAHDSDLMLVGTAKTGASLQLKTANNVIAVTIDENQNVGVGTTPSILFDVLAEDGVRDNEYVARLRNQESTDGRSYGVEINAGSNSDDVALLVRDHDAANVLLSVLGSGEITAPNIDSIGATTGHEALYVNTTTGEIVRYTP